MRSPRGHRYGWYGLVQVAAAVETILLLAAGTALHDLEALVFGFVLLLSLAWIRLRPGILPVLIRGLVFADVAAWMAPAAVSNGLSHEALAVVLLPLALASTSIVGLVAAIGFIVARGSVTAGSRVGRGLAALGVGVFVVGAGIAALTASNREATQGGDLIISATNARYSTHNLSANSGTVSVSFTNNDLFWHTFTIDRLGVEIRVPVKGHRRATFNAPPGTYTFYCAIPGHAAIGMHGILVIR